MKKRTISAVVLAPVFLLVFLYALFISPLGGPTAAYIANLTVPGLDIDDIEGGFAEAFTVRNLNWQNEQWQVHLDEGNFDITWRCLFEPRVCINHFALRSLHVTQLAESESEDEQTSSQDFSLPLAFEVAHGELEDFRLSLLTQDIHLAALSLNELQGNQKIALGELNVNALTISMNAASDTSPATTTNQLPKSYAMSYTAPALPTIASPIPIVVRNFSLHEATFIQNQQAQTVHLFSFENLTFEKSALSLSNILIEHPQGSAKGSIDVTLEDTYPLDLNITGAANIDGVEDPQRFDIDASGSLAALELGVDTDGMFNGAIHLNANILDDSLPMSFTARWREQSLPTMPNATLHDGAISLKGEMGNYLLTGNSAATLAEMGKVPVDLNVILKEKNIYVTQAQISALGGTLSNTGTLYLDQAISWQGNTTLSEVSATQFSRYAPDKISGQFDSVMQWTERGLEVSIQDAALDGVLQNKPLKVRGALVYSQPNDLAVANLNIEQQQNKITVTGQVFNNRYLNADIDMNLAAISSLYPDISGTINGKIKASGPWQNPNAEGKILFSDVAVSEQISAALAEQGPFKGALAIDGAYTGHRLGIDVASNEHDVQVTLDGKWYNNTWEGQIANSQLNVAHMQWNLQSPFALSVDTTTFNTSVGAHCWLSRREGELCIDNIDYRDSSAKWTLSASDLPLGLWAHELLPDTVSKASDATLSFSTQGKYSPQNPIDATFSARVSPAQWQVGTRRPLTIDISDVQTTGSFTNGLLTANSVVTSDDLGHVEVNLKSELLEESPPISGQIVLNDIDVAPLKPLSPAIRTLTGVLNGNISIDGSVASPELSGDMSISNGAIDIEDTPVSLDNWQQTITLNGQQATFDGSFILGGGEGALDGSFSWNDQPTASINVKGKNFEVRQPNMRFRVSPDISVAATTEKVDVTGSVNIPWARIEIESLPESAVSPSKDVHLRGEPPKEEPLDIVHASVMVGIDRKKTGEVQFEAFGLKASLHGGIRVNTQPALVGYGDLQILNGRYNAYGQQLVIQTGEVQFNGPIDQPMLLVEAIRDPNKTDDDVIAGIRIDGAADAPSINLFSDPAMDQQNILSYLLTGEGADSSSGSQDPNYAALLLGFGLSNTKTLTGSVGEAIGIDDFSLSTNESKLSVKGQINDRLSVEYNVDVGLSNNDTNATLRRRQAPPDLALRYRLLPRLFLEAVQTTIEDQSEFALDLYYEFFVGAEDEEKKAKRRRRAETDNEDDE